MPKLHVLPQQEALDPARLQDKVVIVLDILFATSTIVHAFGEEVASVWPAHDHADAVRLGADCADAVLAGEFLADALPNFATAAPLALGSLGLRGRRLVYSTTNGTPALHRASAARHVYSGRTVEWRHGGRPCGARASGCAGIIAVRRFAGALQPGRLLRRRPSSHLLQPIGRLSLQRRRAGRCHALPQQRCPQHAAGIARGPAHACAGAAVRSGIRGPVQHHRRGTQVLGDQLLQMAA
ncbi:2-phosphosulfolactate phosphatase [Rhodanobacter sp. OR444]|uniref:2-phosphosulfolactate phosphatase n=1 Tax=Rhodanobacter sp. OR444 TaxID=1076525 RepID=UPI0009DB9F92|nr:2-phosphosulfolactate phosphatase [Rhodanobacter sp. OR444]